MLLSVAAMMMHFFGERQNSQHANYLNDFLYKPTHIFSPIEYIAFYNYKALSLESINGKFHFCKLGGMCNFSHYCRMR
jgi:hypothetical protein